MALQELVHRQVCTLACLFLGMWGDHDAEGVVLLVVNAGEVPIHRLGLGLGHIGGLKDGWKKRVVEYRK